MTEFVPQPVAIVGIEAIMPESPDASAFWANIKGGRYCITDVPKERWDPDLYYDPDPEVPDKTYSRIGGWVREFPWNPMAWKLPIPPKVADQLDEGQKWSLSASRSALLQVGWPKWNVDPDRVAVILGNAIGGEKHYQTNLRIQSVEVLRELYNSPTFASLPDGVREAIFTETHKSFLAGYPEITEDTMPGELANVLAGRVCNLFGFRGPNFTTDAACASGLAAMSCAVQGLLSDQYDAVVTGGVDRNMSVGGFVKFCKIGALSATGTRPFDAGADGFVMGEGAALFVLKRLADAERDGDRIYSVLLGIGGSSDGKGKGITAPNPIGQRLALERAWRNAGADPATVTMLEAHGTSTRVGDAGELESLTKVFGRAGAAPGSIALGSVKSNIGHLKAAAGTAGLFKAAMSLHEKVLPPSLNFNKPNPNVDWANFPFRVNTELRDWPTPPSGIRRAGVSAFGFGGTNFHAVLEEYIPGRYPTDGKRTFAGAAVPQAQTATVPQAQPGGTASGAPGVATQPQAQSAQPQAQARPVVTAAADRKPPLRGALVVGGGSPAEVVAQLQRVQAEAAAGRAPDPAAPDPALADAAIRVAIDYGSAGELADKIAKALKGFSTNNAAMWRMLRSQGVFVGRGSAPPVAFLYTGQGSQYVNMLEELRETEPIVARTFAEADRIMTPLLGKPLTAYIFAGHDAQAVTQMEQQLLQTEITQPAVLATDLALTRLLDAYGVRPDMVMGHSLGEYGALVAAGALSFEAALEAVSARGREMASLSMGDNGAMAAVFAPLPEIERIVATADGYVVIANVNSHSQAVIGGESAAVDGTVEAFGAAGYTAMRIPVSHAFHTSIVAPASVPLKAALRRLDVRPPVLPIVANVTGEFYPEQADVETMLDILGQQVASPVQFVKGLETLYAGGARVFVEVGPKKALHGFVEDVLGSQHDDVLALFTNHPKLGDLTSLNQALCGLYAAGLGLGAPTPAAVPTPAGPAASVTAPAAAAATGATPTAGTAPVTAPPATAATSAAAQPPASRTSMTTDRYAELGRLFADFLEQGRRVYEGTSTVRGGDGLVSSEPVVVTGAALGLPGVERVFDDENIRRILEGQQFIDLIPHRTRRSMVDKHITRLVKRETGDPTFETIDSEADVIKLAGRHGPLDAVTEFGIEPQRDQALDTVTRLAIGAGFDALRDAGVPLAMHYKTTTLGTQLPDRWGLPDALRDETGIVFASAFPGYDAFAEDIERYHEDRARREQLAALEAVRARLRGDEAAVAEVDRRIRELRHVLETEPFVFDRRFLFRVLSMGHSQFAEIIGARGPNTQVNAACASTTQALSIAEDWIRTGRCRRVVVVSADDVTTDRLLPWIGSGFLASGAAATDDVVEEAATPFDRRRHGMIVGMGAAALVVESAEAARERGIQPICEVLSTVIANSAFHGTRLDLSHICQVMEQLIRRAEARGIDRHAIAPSMAFVSHETYTPARGGSASAEVNALRTVFGPQADSIVITNTKGFTGHAMGAGIEDVVAVKALETGVVPPVPNYKEPDPDLGNLNLSQGGAYPVEYSLRLAAGFGSQIAMALLRWTPMPDRQRRAPSELGYAYRIIDEAAWRRWLELVSGRPNAKLEVVQHRLRVVDEGAPVITPATTLPAVTPLPATGAPAAPTPIVPSAPAVATLAPPVAPAAVAPAPIAPPFVAPVPAQPIAPTPSPAATAPAAAVEAPAADAVTDAVVSIVAQMTGYPPELLDVDLDLEADLGVDTVKQAEVFAAVRERYDIERDENLQLRDFPTLRHVVGWVREKTGIAPPGQEQPAEAVQPETAPAPAEAPATATIQGDLAATDRMPRRVPVPVLRPDLAQCKPTGVTLGEGSRVVVMRDSNGVGDALVKRLHKLGGSALVLAPEIGTDDLLARLDKWLADGPVHGVYWLPALDDEGPLTEMDLAGWREALRSRVKNLYATMRRLYDATPFLVSATRLGGFHGYDEEGATAPLGGAVTGFTKAYKREKPEALVKAVDFPASRKTKVLADVLIEETLRDPGCVEVGRGDDRRWAIGLVDRPFGTGGPGAFELNPGNVFVVTGAAGSIVSAITADLAAASGGTFHLLDLTPTPDPADPHLAKFASDRDGLKVDIAGQLKERGERATPVAIEKELARYERLQAALTAIQAVQHAGGTAHYHSVDLTDAEAVGQVIENVRATSGRIDVLLHAAGLEISRNLPEKEPREYNLVLDVKSDGWFNVLRAAGDMPIGATVVFSSVAGRFGNVGQTDYSAANDLLCKTTSSFRRTRPETRGIALDWTAWGGIGMATRGSIPKIMEMAGIEMLPPDAGIAWIRRELISSGERGEVLVAGAMGMMMEEFDETGGLDVSTVSTEGTGPVVGTVEAAGIYTGLVVRTELDPTRQPFLYDHRIDGTAVLPGVMGIEGFAEVAALLVPGWHVAAVENVEFLSPVKFYRDEPRTLTIRAVLRRDGADLVADCRLEAERKLPGSDTPVRSTHFSGLVRLTTQPPAPERDDTPLKEATVTVTAPDVYRVYFHGPAYQVIGSAWRHDGSVVARLADELPPNHDPAELPTVIGPRLVELCFQTAGLWDISRSGRLGLPQHVDRVRVLRDPAAVSAPLFGVADVRDDRFDCAVVEENGDVVLRVDGYRTVELPGGVDEDARAPLAAAMSD